MEGPRSPHELYCFLLVLKHKHFVDFNCLALVVSTAQAGGARGGVYHQQIDEAVVPAEEREPKFGK